jgi:hypothetical protein
MNYLTRFARRYREFSIFLLDAFCILLAYLLGYIFRFIDNEFPIIVDGEDVYFKDLDTMAQNRLNSYSINVQIYYSYSDDPITDDEKIIIFNHYNFAGTPQEEEHKNKLYGFLNK